MDGKFFALLFVPLSVITSLHWIVYIAQTRIQNRQRIRYETNKKENEDLQGKFLMDDSNRYDVVDPSRKIVHVVVCLQGPMSIEDASILVQQVKDA